MIQEGKSQQSQEEEQVGLETLREIMSKEGFQSTLSQIERMIPFKSFPTWAYITAYIFETIDSVEQFTKACSKIQKGVCAHPIESNEQSYKCLDCGRENDSHVLCESCFVSGLAEGRHENHRFIAQTDLQGCCDCGDISSIKKQGFCCFHSGQTDCKEKLDETLYKKLQQVLNRCFQLLFHYCDQSMTHTHLFPESNLQKSNFQIHQINIFIRNISDTLCLLISDYCNNKLPLQMAISEIMMKPFNRKLKHICNSNRFEETFCNVEEHICGNTIVELLLKYSIALINEEQSISKIIYSLFVNSEFRAYISKSFLQNVNFMTVIFQKNNNPIVSVLVMYEMYHQFFAGKLTDNFIAYPAFQNIKQNIEFMFKLVNKRYFGQYNNTVNLINIYSELKDVIKSEKKENLGLRLLQDIMELSYHAGDKVGVSFYHHQIKLELNNSTLALFQSLISIIRHEDKESKHGIEALIHLYFEKLEHSENKLEVRENPEEVKEEKKKVQEERVIQGQIQVEDQQQNNEQEGGESSGTSEIIQIIELDWYILPELCLGTLFMNTYVYNGKQHLSSILDRYRKNGLLKKYISKLMTSQINAYTISKSKEVGFPGEYPPKQLYQYFYKFVMFDSVLNTLNIIMQIAPEYFIEEISNIEPSLMVQLLSDLFLQQTSFVNSSTMCDFQTEMTSNSLKIQLINILNLKGKATFNELKQLYFDSLFDENVTYDEVFAKVANYDEKNQQYTIKEKYASLQEAILIKRSEQTYENLFENQQAYLDCTRKDNLFEQQSKEQWNTLSKIASQSLTAHPYFVQVFEKVVNFAWKSEQSNKNYENAKLIYVVLLRNPSNQKLQDLMKPYYEIVPETLPQKLIHQNSKKLKQKETVSSTKIKEIKQNPKLNRMKAHIERLKKQQEQFVQNNSILIKEISEDLSKEKKQEQNICLICQQAKIEDEYPCFALSTSIQNIDRGNILTYLSCGHLFHYKCISSSSEEQTQYNCPVCQYPWDLMFPMIPPSEIEMLNPLKDNQIRLKTKKEVNFYRCSNLLLYKMAELVSSRIHLSILDSCSKFYNKDRNQLRSFYCKYVSEGDKNNQLLKERELIDDILERTELLMNRKQFAAYLIGLVLRLLIVPFYMKSKGVKDVFISAVSTQYTCFFADNLLCFIDENTTDIYAQLNANKEIFDAKMNEFCKGVIFTYALLFDDQRNQILLNIEDQDKVGEILTKTYPDILYIRKDFFEQYINKYKKTKGNFDFVPKSLVPTPGTLFLPQNYMQFHKKYYDLICSDCEGICHFNNNQMWLCLLCGYQGCLRDCGQYEFEPNVSLQVHFQKYHNSEGIAIELNSTMVGIFLKDLCFSYGYMYENGFGKYGNSKVKDWTQLKLNSNRWNRLLYVLRRRELFVYAFQNNLPVKQIVNDQG